MSPGPQFRTQRERAAYALGRADAQQDAATQESATKLSRSQVAAMSPQEAAQRLPEIEAWLKAGSPEPEVNNDAA